MSLILIVAFQKAESCPPLPLRFNPTKSLLRAFADQGDRASFEALVDRYKMEIYNYLRRNLGDDAMAEDAFQTTFVRVFQKSEQFDASRKFRPWLYGIATHQAIDFKATCKTQPFRVLICRVQEVTLASRRMRPILPINRQSTVDPLEQAELRARM